MMRWVTLTNKRGLHARAATRLVQEAAQFSAQLTLLRPAQNDAPEKQADLRNIMSLLMLAAPCGSELQLIAEGDDAENALDHLEALIHNRFDEDE
ncbi:phosphate ABC transporter permease [Terasakiispira papahanaumokuakeensis]|uniref:Phosphate ABC transporter permease n=1 Tax=Terasakiispira papahanaumokuakeensis TaxID=197479 RepID=A0A1E2V7N4_9GAMM|nr:HPr family phosphocarrier protein [Terasakiispira papahanaumokuakeensis]ODC02665.1 phosphate ABC transporter permease [Terasakiispira papahanaumokuakeensis]